MPNHVTNIMDVKGPEKDVEAFCKAVSSNNPKLREYTEKEMKAIIARAEAKLKEEPNNFIQHDLSQAQEALKDLDKSIGTLDFNGTIPTPIEVRNTTSPPQDDEEKKQQERNKEKYGSPNWYDWSVANWGTKWNAYDVRDIEDLETESGQKTLRYRFDTAWSPPGNWLEATSSLFPSLEFTDCWRSEGGGSGKIIVREDSYDEEEMPEHDWLMEFDEAYRDEYEFITEGEYGKVIKQYLEANSCDWSYLEEVFLNRIGDRELPLFLSFKWYCCGDKYEERCKNCGGIKTPARRISWSEKE